MGIFQEYQMLNRENLESGLGVEYNMDSCVRKKEQIAKKWPGTKKKCPPHPPPKRKENDGKEKSNPPRQPNWIGIGHATAYKR